MSRHRSPSGRSTTGSLDDPQTSVPRPRATTDAESVVPQSSALQQQAAVDFVMPEQGGSPEAPEQARPPGAGEEAASSSPSVSAPVVPAPRADDGGPRHAVRRADSSADFAAPPTPPFGTPALPAQRTAPADRGTSWDWDLARDEGAAFWDAGVRARTEGARERARHRDSSPPGPTERDWPVRDTSWDWDTAAMGAPRHGLRDAESDDRADHARLERETDEPLGSERPAGAPNRVGGAPVGTPAWQLSTPLEAQPSAIRPTASPAEQSAAGAEEHAAGPRPAAAEPAATGFHSAPDAGRAGDPAATGFHSAPDAGRAADPAATGFHPAPSAEGTSAWDPSARAATGVAAESTTDGARPPAEDVLGEQRTSFLGAERPPVRPSPVDVQTTAIIEPDTSLLSRTTAVSAAASAQLADADEEPTRVTRSAGRPTLRRRRRTGTAPRGLMIGLVAAAVIALMIGGTVLVRAGLTTLSGDDTTAAPPIAEPTPPALALPEPPATPPAATPAPDPNAAAEAAKERAKKAEAAKKQQEARAGSGSGVLSLANCAKKVSDGASLNQAVASAAPGQKICAVGNMGGSRLQINKGGTPAAPVQVIGDGSTTVKGITVDASNVVVAGFNSVGGQAPGVQLTGNNITLRNNKVSKPTGGDYDGLRFFGNNLKILNNTISDINPGGTGAHADCMQTFQSDTPSSKNVVIDGNRCERVDNMCLMAEGPGDKGDGGEGVGESSNWVFSNNYCDTHAGQALMIEAVQNVTVRNNQIVGKVDKAFAFDIGSTGAKVIGNKLAPGIGYEVGMDSSSRSGYQGPAVGGAP